MWTDAAAGSQLMTGIELGLSLRVHWDCPLPGAGSNPNLEGSSDRARFA